MTHDELEFLISQHLDGTLDAADSTKLQHVLATNADASALLASYAKLDDALKGSRRAAGVDEDWLAAQIAARLDEPPARSLRMPTWAWATPLAAAAGLAVVLTLGVLFHRDADPSDRPLAVAQVTLTGPPAESTVTGGYTSVSVGIPSNLTPAIVAALYLSDASQVSRVVVRPAGEARSLGTLE